MKNRALLVGGLHKARSSAASLIQKGYQVTMINSDYQDCLMLAEIDSLTVIYGGGTKPFILEDAGAQDADIAIALTQRDEDNFVICELCKKRFAVKKTVALVNAPKKTEFFYRMEIDSVVCAVTAITSILEQQAILDGIATLIPIGESRMEATAQSESTVLAKKPAGKGGGKKGAATMNSADKYAPDTKTSA